MHMADALLSPAVGGTMLAVSCGAIAWSSAKVRTEMDDRRVPLMGVLGAFLFAAQMINFVIPATGSSGHLGGGLFLTILLGPHAGFLVIASVLVVQALFFADGGLLALGCNMFNMGFIPAFIVYPLIYKKIAANIQDRARFTVAVMGSAVAALQFGSLAVVLETFFSHISSLPFTAFLFLMQPVHLALGLVEGAATVALVSFVFKARPEFLADFRVAVPIGSRRTGTLLAVFLVAALCAGGIGSRFASKSPDGLEWAIEKITGKEELKGPVNGVHGMLASVQVKTAFMPDYSFRKSADPKGGGPVRFGTSLAGVSGTLITLFLVALAGFILKRRAAV